MKKILVIGSLNMDTVLEVSYLPQTGETISGQSLTQNPGGKGANQAYAIGKLGGNVTMIGAVGVDAAGNELLENLKSVNVDVCGIEQIEDIFLKSCEGVIDDTYTVVHELPDNAESNTVELINDLLREGRQVAYLMRQDSLVSVVGYKK